ncbi:MAG TPA: amidohydrolase, partial [Anaerolineae bacterium]|nr:amidohydrolase [Anaerolineae bacterium]
MQTKQDVIQWLEDHQARFTALSDAIWANPEVAWQEFRASKAQADLLVAEGFRITWNLGVGNTAFVAEWGEGRPIIGFLGEFDALPGLSQKRQPTQEPVVAGGPG